MAASCCRLYLGTPACIRASSLAWPGIFVLPAEPWSMHPVLYNSNLLLQHPTVPPVRADGKPIFVLQSSTVLKLVTFDSSSALCRPLCWCSRGTHNILPLIWLMTATGCSTEQWTALLAPLQPGIRNMAHARRRWAPRYAM